MTMEERKAMIAEIIRMLQKLETIREMKKPETLAERCVRILNEDYDRRHSA